MSLVTSSPTKENSIEAAKKIQGEGFKREWSPLIKMDEAMKAKVNGFPGNNIDIHIVSIMMSA